MTYPRTRFLGTLEQLQKNVALTGVAGEWQPMPADYWRYRCDNGAILNWWPSTKTYNFQGPKDAKRAFEQRLISVVNQVRSGARRLPPPWKQ